MNSKKIFLSRLFNFLGLNTLFLILFNFFFGNKYIRVVNYHDTPKHYDKNFEEHLKFYKKKFHPVSLKEFENFIEGRQWKHSKPGIIISFDDGMKSNFEVASPLLEKHGFIGIFFIPAGFINLKKSDAKKFMADNNIFKMSFNGDEEDISMSWNDLRILEKKHVIGSHTFNHHRMNEKDNLKILQKEIIHSKDLINDKMANEIIMFCWVGGEEHTYTNKAAKYIHSHYKYSFMTNTHPITLKTLPHQIQRTNIEVNFPLFLVKFQLSGIMDILYINKKNRVERITSV